MGAKIESREQKSPQQGQTYTTENIGGLNQNYKKAFTHGSLFSGIGGFDLAAEWMGWENVFHCEWNEFGKRVLKYYWPNAISYNDITKTDFSIHRGAIDILTGGFPCQPYSMAGKRKGKDDERHLWPEMLRAIREIQPRWVVGENVFGLINWSRGMVFAEVQADLEAAGYEVWPYVLPACAVNAPHRRDRVWFVAHSYGSGDNRAERTEGSIWKYENTEQQRDRGAVQINGPGNERIATDTERGSEQGQLLNGQGEREFRGCNIEITSNSNHDGRQENTERNTEGQATAFQHERLYLHEPITNSIGIRGNENEWRGIRESDELNQNGAPRNWQDFPTQSPICNGDDGLSSKLDAITFPKWRSESIKSGGNAIVPNVAFEIFKAIERYEIQNSFDNAA